VVVSRRPSGQVGVVAAAFLPDGTSTGVEATSVRIARFAFEQYAIAVSSPPPVVPLPM
jgi:hypothetical protein